MKAFRIVVPALIAILLFNGCKKDKYVFLTEEDLALMLYSEGQQIKFKNPSGAILKFTAFAYTRGYVEMDGAQSEGTNINFRLDNDTVAGEKGFISVQASSEGTFMTITFPRFEGTLYPLLSSAVTDTIGGTIYADLTVGDANNFDNIHFIKRIYYSKASGFLQLVDYNNVAWNRFN